MPSRILWSGPVGPENEWEFVCPFAFSPCEASLEVVDNDLVAGFGLSVRLRIPRCRCDQLDVPLVAEGSSLMTDELGAVVAHDF